MKEEYTLRRELKVYISKSFDPKFNLALEEWLLNSSTQDEVILFLWQNENTIVIGRNQNPYKECDVEKLKDDNVQLVRRISGGGAVYHDIGNLNFTFIASDKNYDVETNMKIILNGISKFGIHGSFSGRNDLVVKDKKFSGNAFFSDKEMNCHHGTLLVDVDLKKLSKYLTVSPLKLKSKGIDSVVSRVINLKEISPKLTIEALREALIISFNEFYKGESQRILLKESKIDVTTYIQKYESWEWNYSQSPDFSISIEDKFPWGVFEIHLEISDGTIKDCMIFTDTIIQEDFKVIEKSLLLQKVKADSITKVFEECIKSNEIKRDLVNLISGKL